MGLTSTNALVSIQDGAGNTTSTTNGSTALVTPGAQITVTLSSTTGVLNWELRLNCPAFPSLHNVAFSWKAGQANIFQFTMPAPASAGTSFYNAVQLISVVSDGVSSIASATAYIQTIGQLQPGMVAKARLVTNAALAAYTYSNGVITANANGAMATVDSVAPAVGDYILLTLGAAGSDNGLYQVTSLGGASAPFVLTRDANHAHGMVVPAGQTYEISEGTVWTNNMWKATVAGPVTVGTTDPTLFPRIQMGSGATGGGTTIALTTLWALSATLSHMFTQDRTAANATFIGTIVVGRGVGTATITGTTAHTIDWVLINW